MRIKAFLYLAVICQSVMMSQARAQVGVTEAIRPFLSSEATSIVLEGGRVIDGTGTAAQEGLSILIENGLIRGLGPAEQLAIPSDAERIDLSGHTILPGLIFLHEHFALDPIFFSDTFSENRRVIVTRSQPAIVSKLLLAAGITTVRSPGSSTPQGQIEFARRVRTGEYPGPEIFTGPFLNGPENAYIDDFIVRTADEAREMVQFWAARGATVIKAYSSLSAEAMQAAADEAHRHGIQMTAHLGGAVTCLEAAGLGLDSLEHAFGECRRDADFDIDRLISALVENDVALIDTPNQPLTEAAISLLTAEQRADYDALMARRTQRDPEAPTMNPVAEEWTHRFVEAGGKMLLGTDAMEGGMPGDSAHSVMVTYASSFSPLEVIRMVTSDAAEFLRIDERTGRIAVGLEADLLIVRGAPDNDMRDIRNVAYIFADGVAYSPERLRDSVAGQIF